MGNPPLSGGQIVELHDPEVVPDSEVEMLRDFAGDHLAIATHMRYDSMRSCHCDTKIVHMASSRKDGVTSYVIWARSTCPWHGWTRPR